jgi:hypothetical protein
MFLKILGKLFGIPSLVKDFNDLLLRDNSEILHTNP